MTRPTPSTPGTGRLRIHWAIPSTAVSGVYFAKLTTDTGNFQNMIPFIVRNDGTDLGHSVPDQRHDLGSL